MSPHLQCDDGHGEEVQVLVHHSSLVPSIML
jgi:hypothetical protein